MLSESASPASPSPKGVLQRCTNWMLAIVCSKLHWFKQIFHLVSHAGDGTENKKLQEAQAATVLGLCKNLVLTLGKGIIGFTANSQVASDFDLLFRELAIDVPEIEMDM